MAAVLRHVRSTTRIFQNAAVYEIPRHGLHTQSLAGRLRFTQCCRHPHTFLNSRWRHQVPICSAMVLRWNSSQTEAAAPTTFPEGYIPEPPPLPNLPALDATPDLNALGEATIQSMGLGNWTPPGVVQMGLDALHVGCDLPWWGAIVASTIIVRTCIFPLVLMAQRNAAQMHNHMPTITRLQERFTKSRTSGNPMEAARAANELMDYMKRNKVSPGRSMMVPLAQMPIFISFFIGLRGMANLPVESMRTGGILWFTDLTVPDPFYALPILTMTTFLVTIEVGVDGVKAGSMGQNMKWVMRIMPIVILPFMINFPAAMLCYWMTTNCFSLIQVLFLKIPRVRQFFKIPQMVKHPEQPKTKKKGFGQGFKETWQNSKLMAQIEDRQRLENVRFKEAGQGPLVKTYPYDPTKGKAKVAAKK